MMAAIVLNRLLGRSNMVNIQGSATARLGDAPDACIGECEFNNGERDALLNRLLHTDPIWYWMP